MGERVITKEELMHECSLKIYQINKIEDKMFLVGPPGIGKSYRLQMLARKEAMLMGKQYFVDITDVVPGRPVRYNKAIGISPQEAIHVGKYWEPFDRMWSFQEFLEIYNREEEVMTSTGKKIVYPEREKMYFFAYTPAPHILPEDLSVPNTKAPTSFFLPKLAFWLKILSDPGVDGVWFIDEITNVSDMRRLALLYAAIQERKVGFAKIPKTYEKNGFVRGVKIVSAGNPPKWGGMTELPAPLLNRLLKINVLPPETIRDVKMWIKYMDETFADTVGYDNEGMPIIREGSRVWDFDVGAFLLTFTDMIMAGKVSPSTLEPFPSPRSWTNLALFLYRAKKDPEFSTKITLETEGGKTVTIRRLIPTKIKPYIYGYVGYVAAVRYMLFLELRPPSPKEVCIEAKKYIMGHESVFRKMFKAAAKVFKEKTEEKTTTWKKPEAEQLNPSENEKMLVTFMSYMMIIGTAIDSFSDECWRNIVRILTENKAGGAALMISKWAGQKGTPIAMNRLADLTTIIRLSYQEEVEEFRFSLVEPHLSKSTYRWWKHYAASRTRR